ncbi:MAG TPA: STAS domain-containing protein [Burkholderiales bacterium]|nr:STAS domain-containing protein [Burkholderiales bacterium]
MAVPAPKPKPVDPYDLGLEYVPYFAEAFAPSQAAPRPVHAKATGPKSVAPKAAKPPGKTGPKSIAKAPVPEDESAPNSVLIVEVESGKNEVPSVIEEAAMLFANGQPQDALDKLDKAIGSGKLQSWTLPAWLMRFDAYQDLGRKSEFEEKALDFIVKFERSPPAWIDLPEAIGRPGSSANVTLSGPLSAASASAFNQLRKAAEKQSKLRIDLGKLDSIDAAGCSLLLDTIKFLRAAKKEVYISGEAVALDLLCAHTVPGHAQVEQCFWLLLLDLYQQLGMLEKFEEAAVDYAVTYEVSPPSWEARPRVEPPPAAKPEASGAREPSDDSFHFQGEIAGQQDALMQALTAYTAKASPVLLDFTLVRRMDYVNAGRLTGVVEKAVEAGKAVVLRGAGEMTIALFAVLGLHQRARIIPRK